MGAAAAADPGAVLRVGTDSCAGHDLPDLLHQEGLDLVLLKYVMSGRVLSRF